MLNLFRMVGMLRGDRVKAESTGAVALDKILASGVRETADVNALATAGDREMAILVWNYHDDDLPSTPATVQLAARDVPGRVLVEHYRIDDEHSNAYTVWKQMGSPQQPTPEQYARLEASGQLQLLTSPEWRRSNGGTLALEFPLPHHAVSLVRISW